ncbi:two-component sensor histidine kinase [Lewinellaceae bacterium SD302]|nr:two-component sensor histidine kinase [Lewinellaceae bacterium SD302]
MLSRYFGGAPWKWIIGLFGALIVVASVIYTQYLAERLAAIEENYTRIYARAQEDINQVSDEELNGDICNCCDYSLAFKILESNTTVPTILVDDQEMRAFDGMNFRDSFPDSTFLQSTLDEWIADGVEPILSAYSTSIYMGESRMLKQLRLFPFVQALLILAFVFFGYFALNAARRAEQNRVWVGLAKETAHQLGTPISAMVGWTEHLRLMYADQPDIIEVADELEKDVDRLEMVATRFSKIGSEPELKPVNIYQEIATVCDYMSKRAPRKVTFDFPSGDEAEVLVNVNSSLFDWVIENLLRNGLDALEGKGHLSGRIIEEPGRVLIEISDTGKGIPPGKFSSVFKPGYTTKQRGWGLGLSLAKRIVEQYHGGKIYVKESEVGKGTTFAIVLPRIG